MGHSSGVVELPGHIEPAVHSVQTSIASDGLYEPGGHPIGKDEPAGQYVPRGHSYPVIPSIGCGDLAPCWVNAQKRLK